MKRYTFTDSPLGRILLVSDGASLTGLYFTGQKDFPRLTSAWRESPQAIPFAAARRELREFFSGRRRHFDVPLKLEGTEFQLEVWQEIARVPFGRTATYGELARKLGRPRGARAAGAATGRNPISILVPCHRILGADGRLTGYAGGTDRKEALLALEARVAAKLQAGLLL